MSDQIKVKTLISIFLFQSKYLHSSGFTIYPKKIIRPQEIHTNLNKNHAQNARECQLPIMNLSYNQNQYDMSKPTFDPLSLRTIRNDALVQYSSLNQSEPLRINLYFLLACTLFAFPTISESIGVQLPENVPNFLVTLISVIAGSGSGFYFVQECKARSKQLTRIERELNSEFLNVKMPDILGGSVLSLKELAKNQQKKIVALAGPRESVKKVLNEATLMRRRLVQSNTLLVILPIDVSNKDSQNIKWKWEKDDAGIIGGRWLAEAHNLIAWTDYFTELVDVNNIDNTAIPSTDGLVWFGLNPNRRSFGSGFGSSSLTLLQLMGSFLRPTVIIDESDPPEKNSRSDLIAAQKSFYDALTNGDDKLMQNIWRSSFATEVTEVIDSGGRIDGWKSCLAEGARPEGMIIADSDSWVKSETEAFTTTIEFPPMAPMDNGMLLAIQKWNRESKDDAWKLALHQTIPWTPETRASGTLRCDCRGCVALTRSRERRTFGGLIGL